MTAILPVCPSWPRRFQSFAPGVLTLVTLLTGCVSDTALLRTDNTPAAQAMTQTRAMADLKCREAVADRPIRSDRMDDWPDELYSEYTSWAEGCGRRVSYVVVCRNGNLCAFADLPQAPAE